MTGTGRLEGTDRLVIPAPIYTCDDGSEAVALSGPPLQDLLRNLTYVHDPRIDVLTVGPESVWTRVRGQVPSVAPTISETMWPQSSLEEVRQAQELADAGDPDYTWQVGARLVDDDTDRGTRSKSRSSTGSFVRYWAGRRTCSTKPGRSAIGRALRRTVGWRPRDRPTIPSLWAGAHQPAVPTAARPEVQGELCAPTIDDLHYETVSLDMAQLDRQGRDGIWVVNQMEAGGTVAQADPAVVEAQATERLEAFLAARVAGNGAEGRVQSSNPTQTFRSCTPPPRVPRTSDTRSSAWTGRGGPMAA